MSADNDIVESLLIWKTGPVLREHPGFFLVPEADIDKAAAEIGRLRGEVEARISPDWVIGYFPTDVAEEVKRAVRDAFGEWNALSPKPAPAMPNGMEGLIDDLATALVMYNQSCITMQSLAGSVGDFLKSYHALRAADNRNAAGVAEEKGDVLLDYVLPCDVAVAPATKISKGVRLRTLLSAIRLRESDGPQFEPGAGFRALFDTPQPADGEAMALGWRVRERRSSDGELLDCFIEAPPVDGMAYGLEVLGDDYTGYGDVEGKLAHCKMIVAWANATPPSAQVQQEASRLVDGLIDIAREIHAPVATHPAVGDKVLELLKEAGDTVEASTVEDGISDNRRLYRIELAARIKAALAQPQSEEAS